MAKTAWLHARHLYNVTEIDCFDVLSLLCVGIDLLLVTHTAGSAAGNAQRALPPKSAGSQWEFLLTHPVRSNGIMAERWGTLADSSQRSADTALLADG